MMLGLIGFGFSLQGLGSRVSGVEFRAWGPKQEE